MSLNVNALLSQAELELILQITISSSDLKDFLINTASDFINNFTNRRLLSRTITSEKYDGTGESRLFLKEYPITSVTAVKSWDSYNNVVSYTYTEHTEYTLYANEGYILFRGKTLKGHNNYQITYVAGYALADVPYDLKNACAQLCGIMYYNKGKAGIKSESIGSYSVTYDKGNASIMGIPVPDDIAGVIRQYRRINV